jgi:hypothetical protein
MNLEELNPGLRRFVGIPGELNALNDLATGTVPGFIKLVHSLLTTAISLPQV